MCQKKGKEKLYTSIYEVVNVFSTELKRFPLLCFGLHICSKSEDVVGKWYSIFSTVVAYTTFCVFLYFLVTSKNNKAYKKLFPSLFDGVIYLYFKQINH